MSSTAKPARGRYRALCRLQQTRFLDRDARLFDPEIGWRSDWWPPTSAGHVFEVEFYQHSEAHPDGKTIRRNSGQFASERDAETYGLSRRPEQADGFRIWKDGTLRKTVSVRSYS